MAGGRFELAMEPTAIGLVSLNSNSETYMTCDICDARLIHGRVDFTGFYMLCSFKGFIITGSMLTPPPLPFVQHHHHRLE